MNGELWEADTCHINPVRRACLAGSSGAYPCSHRLSSSNYGCTIKHASSTWKASRVHPCCCELFNIFTGRALQFNPNSTLSHPAN